MDERYRIFFIRRGEERPFFSCICWSKYGVDAAVNTIKDLFKIGDSPILKGELCKK